MDEATSKVDEQFLATAKTRFVFVRRWLLAEEVTASRSVVSPAEDLGESAVAAAAATRERAAAEVSTGSAHRAAVEPAAAPSAAPEQRRHASVGVRNPKTKPFANVSPRPPRKDWRSDWFAAKQQRSTVNRQGQKERGASLSTSKGYVAKVEAEALEARRHADEVAEWYRKQVPPVPRNPPPGFIMSQVTVLVDAES